MSKSPHFLLHRFGGGLKPMAEQLTQHLVIHQIFWTAHPCPCLALEDQESFGGVWSIVSPVKHSPEMFASALICRHCNDTIAVETELKYVDVNDEDAAQRSEQLLADLPASPTVQ